MTKKSKATVKRICLFAGFSPKQKIEDYVLFYLKALSDIAVYYCADNEALLFPFFGFPFLKKNAFYMMESVVPQVGLDFVKRFTDYDPVLISAVVEEYRAEKPSFWKYLSVRLNAAFAQNKRHLIGKKRG